MLFYWDPIKASSNLKKHGISFELAQSVFDDPMHLSVIDGKTVFEERWITIGLSANKQSLVVVHTYRNVQTEEEVRIISARKATRKEKEQYEEGI